MNWKSTLLLLVLAGAAGAWLWKGDEWAPRVGLPASAPAAPAASPSLAALADHFKPEQITRVELPSAPGGPLVLERAATASGWKLPGNWPLRKPEVEELVGLFAGITTRFQPVALAADADLTPYGLAEAQKPITAKVTAGGTEYTLAFGEPPLSPGESAFTRPAYLRVNDHPEVLRLGPDVLPVLRRPADNYRRRQLFPDAERVKVAAASAGPFGPPGAGVSTVPLLAERVSEIEARGPGRTLHLFGGTLALKGEAYTLRKTAPFPQPVAAEKGGEPAVTAERIAEAWEVSAPARDHVDPEKLQKILAAIPDLWAEEFVTDAGKAGLENPDRTLTVTRPTGEKVVVLIGAVSKTTTREETVAASPMPGIPPIPMTRTITEEYRYAKLADNPQVFTVKADKLSDVFVSAADLRDPRLTRFAPDDVQEVTVAVPGQPAVKLVRKSGDAGGWVIEHQPEPLPAESSVVSDLLGQLSNLRGRPGDTPAGEPTGGPTVTIVAREKRPDDQPAAPTRTLTLHFGQPKLGPWPVIASATSALVAVAAGTATDAGPVPVRLEGWPRVAAVDAAAAKAAAPAGGFRDRSLASFFGADKLELDRDGRAVTFTKKDGIWKQTAPAEAEVESAEVEDFVSALGRLRAERFAAETPTPAELKQYGLDAPKTRVKVYSGDKLLLDLAAGAKDAEGRVYAKLAAGEAVAVLPADVTTKLAAQYRRKKVWDLDEARVEAVEVERNGAKFRLVRKDAGWHDPAAPDDAIDPKAASELLAVLGGLRAERWVGGQPEELKRAGLVVPAGSVTVTLRDGARRVLLLGGAAADPYGPGVYAMVGEPTPTDVFVLPAADVARLSRDRASYVEKK